MADYDGIISPSPEWVDIPSLSTSAIALGGAAGAGAMNAQAVAFAKRTNYLINYSVQISPATGNAGIGTSSPLGRLQIGDASANANNKIVFGKAQAATETNLPAIGQRSTGTGNDLVLAATSAAGAVKVYAGASTNSGEIGTGSNSEKLRVESSGYVTANGPAARLAVSPATLTNSALTQFVNTAGNAYVGSDGSTGSLGGSAYSLNLWHTGNYPINFATNNILRATFGNDGIFNKIVSSSAGSETVGIRFTNGTQNLGSIRSYNQTGYNQHLRFYTSSGTSSSTENFAMTIDSAGNLGLGVTPSGWSTGAAVELGAVGNALWGYAGNIVLSQNTAGYSGSFKYATASAATRYQQVGGQHQWYTAPSGTAGNPITFTQALTLDAAGNLFLGISPNSWSSGKVLQFGPPASGFLFNDSNNTQLGSNAYFSSGWKYQTSSVGASTYQQTSGGHVWNTAPAGVAGDAISWTTAMTLSPAGNLGIGGTPSGSYKLEVTGSTSTTSTSMARGFGLNATGGSVSTGMNAPASDTLALWTNSSEKLRITSTGDQINYGTGALKIHEGTTAQRPSTPTEGMIRKNSTLGVIEGYSGGGYVSLEAGRLIARTVYSTPGSYTWTPSAKTKHAILILISGGGGSGGCPPTTASQASISVPGSPGQFVRCEIPRGVSLGGSYSVTVGAAGAGGTGSASPTNGVNGGVTIVQNNTDSSFISITGGWYGAAGYATTVFPETVSNVGPNSINNSGGHFVVLERNHTIFVQGVLFGTNGKNWSDNPSIAPCVANNPKSGVAGLPRILAASSAAANGHSGGNGEVIIYEYS